MFGNDATRARRTARGFGTARCRAMWPTIPRSNRSPVRCRLGGDQRTTCRSVSGGFAPVGLRRVFYAAVFVRGRRQARARSPWKPGRASINPKNRLTDERRGQSVEDGDLCRRWWPGWYVSGTDGFTRKRSRSAHGGRRRYETLASAAKGVANIDEPRADQCWGQYRSCTTVGVNGT